MLPMMFNIAPDTSNAGKVIVTSGNMGKLTVTYDPEKFEVEHEQINIEDRKISRNWGDELHRLHFKMRSSNKRGSYVFDIQ
jgi:hypothetical protein